MKTRHKGFTLLELIIVIIIIGVLASLALPRLFRIIKGAEAAEAIAMIGQIRAGLERCYLMHNGNYAGCDADGDIVGVGWEILGMDDPQDAPGSRFRYFIWGGVGYEGSAMVCARNKETAATCDFSICMGVSLKPTIAGDNCLLTIDERHDDKIYWAAEENLKAFVPKSSE